MKRLLTIGLYVLASFHCYGEILSIPLKYTAYPAKDLVDNKGNALTTTQLRTIWNETGDLSRLNPEETDIWSHGVGRKLSLAEDDFSIDQQEEFKFVDSVISVVGSYRFLVQETKAGRKRNFNIWLSKDNRSILLRKNLLRKLGYRVPKIQHHQGIKIKFKGLASLNAFVTNLENGTFADAKRWVTEIDEENSIVYLQDVLVLEGNTRIYNLAMGELADSTVAHRRVMNALSLPFAIVDVRESVDALSWSLGRIDNKVVILDILSGDKFTTTYFDALWMLKRLSLLTKKDLEEIVDFSFYPRSVKLLLVEKLASRINNLQKLFYKKTVRSYPVDFEISDDSGELVKGRLTQDVWEGHAARYSFDDTQSPLSKDEMSAYFKSKFYSVAIENVVTYLNDKFLYETDIQKEAIARAVKAQQKQFENFFQTGQLNDIPFSSWAVPTARGNIRASRDIVTGAYLGADNTIQIADTLEFIAEAGVFVGTLGLPVEVQAFASGNARFSRAYSHIKSIKSIKKALKEPYRNLMVPRLRKQKAKSIVEMIDGLKEESFQALEGDDRTAALEKIFKELDKVMGVGDSLIISNNLIFSGALLGGYRAPINTSEIEMLLNFNARKMNLWRFHLLRAAEREFQFYRSKANALGGGAGFSLKGYLPIVTLNYDQQGGRILTQFQTLKFNQQDDTETIISKLVQLRQVLVENSGELLDKYHVPFIITHHFDESSGRKKILHNQSTEVRLSDRLKVKHPEGFEVKFYLRNTSVLSGKNYMQVAYDFFNALVEETFEGENISFTNSESGNPGDSFYGESFVREALVEIPELEKESEIPFENYARIKSRWKGWSANRAKLREIKKAIDEKYGKGLFNDELFYDTNQIKLYNIDITLNIYAQGLENLVSHSSEILGDKVKKYLRIPWDRKRVSFRSNGIRRNSYRKAMLKVHRRIIRAHENLNADYTILVRPDLVANDLNTLVSLLELYMPFDIFTELLGGDTNFYLRGSVTGFRVGSENGEQAIISNSMGEFGSELTGGILETLRGAINISQGELGAYWFLRRLL